MRKQFIKSLNAAILELQSSMLLNLRKDKIIGYSSQTKKNIVCIKCTEVEECAGAQFTLHGDHINLRISVHLILIYSVYQWDNSYNNLNDFFE